jgi:hypothetical protein
MNRVETRDQPQRESVRHSPLGTLGTVLVGLGVTQRLDVDGAGLLDLVRGAVTDENGLSSPLDDEVLAWDDQLGAGGDETSEGSTMISPRYHRSADILSQLRQTKTPPVPSAFSATGLPSRTTQAAQPIRSDTIARCANPTLRPDADSPSGIEPISTSIFASAKTSAEAAMLLRISATVDFAPDAARTPSEPTMKYERVRFESALEASYGVQSGTWEPLPAAARARDEVEKNRWEKMPVGGAGAFSQSTRKGQTQSWL